MSHFVINVFKGQTMYFQMDCLLSDQLMQYDERGEAWKLLACLVFSVDLGDKLKENPI